MKFIINQGENTLTISFAGQEVELVPYKGNEFKFKSFPGVSVEFKIDASGAVTDAVIKQPGGTVVAKKKIG